MSENTFYSLSQAAQLLGVHYETAARWVRSGKLVGVRLSRRKVVVPKASLDALLTENDSARRQEQALAVGSPLRWLALAGTLTPEEGRLIRASLQDLERTEDEV